MSFHEQRAAAASMLKYYAEELALLNEAEAAIGEVPDGFRLSTSPNARLLEITAPTEDEARVHALLVAQKLHVFPVKKQPYVNWANKPMTKYLVHPKDSNALKFTFTGEGVPETCHVEYDDVFVPAQDSRTTKKARIVCDVPDSRSDEVA